MEGLMKVLFIGAHTDDIEIGCGGTISRLIREGSHEISYVTFSKCKDLARNQKIEEDQEEISKYYSDRGVSVDMLDFPNKCLRDFGEQIRSSLEEKLRCVEFDTVFTHWIGDSHQDHEAVAKDTIRVFKRQNIIMYDIHGSFPAFSANYYVSLEKQDVQSKTDLISMYKTQSDLSYTSIALINANICINGAKAGLQSAEGFYSYRSIQ
jgi:LmbE family N-acetylglucosaminyl deacetylase